MSSQLRVGVIGCGLIGRRRALEAAANQRSRCVVVADPAVAAAREVGAAVGAEVVDDWRRVVDRRDVDAVVVATPNGYLAQIATAALCSEKHVQVEKPMGRNLAEALRMQAEARSAGRLLKIGFNYRFHPAISEAKRRCDRGEIGDVINIRCRHGHGGRPGYEREWRGSRELAGGGELTDQGAHVADLIHWFGAMPRTAFACLQTAVWPIGDLEDNAFGFFRWDSGMVAAFHTSWTQWKNLFSFEVFGTEGAAVVEGLGRSYGTETLTMYRRRPQGGVPETETQAYDGDDLSWKQEWSNFVEAVLDGGRMLGTADDGVATMRMLDALYRSAAAGAPMDL